MSRFAHSARSRPRAVITVLATRATRATLAALGVLAMAASVASPSVASAGQVSADGLQTNVYYSLRDLSTERGTRALYRRITGAAQAVCPGYDSLSPSVVAASRECQRQAIARAIGQIGNARLAEIDASQSSWHG